MRFVQAGVMLLGAASYLGVASLLPGLSSKPGDPVPLIIGGWHALLLLVAALVVIDSVSKARAGKTPELARDLFIVKLAAIPYFLINFIVLSSIALFGATLAAFATAMEVGQSVVEGSEVADLSSLVWGLGSAAIPIGLTYLAMLTTSTYGWATVAQLRRDGRINAGLAALYRVMLLVFVADVAAGILLYVHSRRGETAP